MAKVYPKKHVEGNVYECALERMREAYQMYDHIAVSFSGGKDSTCALHVALEVAHELGRLPLDVFHYDEEAIQPETVDYVRRVANRDDVNMRWYCVPIEHSNGCSRSSPYWYAWSESDRDKWCRELPPEGLTELPFENKPIISPAGLKGSRFYSGPNKVERVIPDGCLPPAPFINGMLFDTTRETVGIVMGIRAAESLRRYRTVAKRSYQNWVAPDTHSQNIYLLKPVYDWSTVDVWTAPKLMGWDYNKAYDVMDRMGITPNQQRICPPFGEEALRSLWIYKEGWPELWDKISERVPGANTAGMYSQSPLYSYRQDDSDFDPNRDPKEQIQEALKLWPIEYRSKVAARVKALIKNHYRRTTQPIPMSDASKSFTGVTWKYLYNIAHRGDMKGRRIADGGRYTYRDSGAEGKSPA